MSYTNLLILGAVAGFTIFLGLPVAMLTTKPRWRALMTALSAGVLLFLLVEITYKCLETVEESAKSYFTGAHTATPLLYGAILFAGFSLGLYALTFFEEHFIGMAKESDPEVRSRRLSLMIAGGIGLHNFGEGLAIGQEYSAGAFSLAYLLIVGFALHNATEGFGIAAPLQIKKVDWKFLGIAGLIGGGPTFIGTILGSVWFSKNLELFSLSLAAGSILYVVGELLHIGKMHGQHRMAMTGILAGFFIAFGSELAIEVGSAVQANRQQPTVVFDVEISEYRFSPSTFEARAGDTVRFKIKNIGKEPHEFEFPDMKVESAIPPGDSGEVTLPSVKAGNYALQCDLPGHKEKGMSGMLVVTMPR